MARGLESRGRRFWRRGKGHRLESVAEEVRRNSEEWRRKVGGMADDGHPVRMAKRTPRMEIGGQARSRQPKGHQDGLVLETVGNY